MAIDIASAAWNGEGESPFSLHATIVDMNAVPTIQSDDIGTSKAFIAMCQYSHTFNDIVSQWTQSVLEYDIRYLLFVSEGGTGRSVAAAEIVAKNVAKSGLHDVILTHYNLDVPARKLVRATTAQERDGGIYYGG